MAPHEVSPSLPFPLYVGVMIPDEASREARHPNVVLYIALSRAPQPDNRIFIISEYIENGAS